MDPEYTPVEMQQMLNEVYADRNRLAHLCAALALKAGLTAGVGVDPDEPDWPVLYTQLPTGQVGWHVPLVELIPGLPPYDMRWDGHTNEEKADRIRRFVLSLASPGPSVNDGPGSSSVDDRGYNAAMEKVRRTIQCRFDEMTTAFVDYRERQAVLRKLSIVARDLGLSLTDTWHNG